MGEKEYSFAQGRFTIIRFSWGLRGKMVCSGGSGRFGHFEWNNFLNHTHKNTRVILETKSETKSEKTNLFKSLTFLVPSVPFFINLPCLHFLPFDTSLVFDDHPHFVPPNSKMLESTSAPTEEGETLGGEAAASVLDPTASRA